MNSLQRAMFGAGTFTCISGVGIILAYKKTDSGLAFGESMRLSIGDMGGTMVARQLSSLTSVERRGSTKIHVQPVLKVTSRVDSGHNFRPIDLWSASRCELACFLCLLALRISAARVPATASYGWQHGMLYRARGVVLNNWALGWQPDQTVTVTHGYAGLGCTQIASEYSGQPTDSTAPCRSNSQVWYVNDTLQIAPKIVI